MSDINAFNNINRVASSPNKGDMSRKSYSPGKNKSKSIAIGTSDSLILENINNCNSGNWK